MTSDVNFHIIERAAEGLFARGMPHRSDYLAVFEAGGIEQLNQAIKERNPNPVIQVLELMNGTPRGLENRVG